MTVSINPPHQFHTELSIENDARDRRKWKYICSLIAVIIILLLLAFILIFVFWRFGINRTRKDTIPYCFKGLETISNVDKGYDYYRKPFNTFHNDLCFPLVIVLVKNELEIRKTVSCALNNSLTVKARAGGHSYEAFSSIGDERTVIIDLRFMDKIRLASNPQENLSRKVTVEAGATLGQLYGVLVDRNLFLPGGTCPSIGVAGLTRVGGKGPFGRKYGMFSDHVTSLRLVNYNGDVIVADKKQNSDLFWALRGGGLWKFGIISEIKFNAIYLDGKFTFISMNWRNISAETGGQIMSKFQNWCKKAPPDVSGLYLTVTERSATLSATFLGPKTAAKQNFKSFIRDVPAPTTNYISGHQGRPTVVIYTYWEQGEYDPNFFKEKGSPENRAATAFPAKSKSEYLNKPMPLSANIELMSLSNKRSNMTNWGFWFAFDCMRGVMSTQDTHMTQCICTQTCFNGGTISNNIIKWTAFDFLSKFESVFRPYATGNHYLGYEDAQIPETNWTKAYHSNHARELTGIKKNYDPKNVFGHTKFSL